MDFLCWILYNTLFFNKVLAKIKCYTVPSHKPPTKRKLMLRPEYAIDQMSSFYSHLITFDKKDCPFSTYEI